jgi:tetratricopeptide (TPR) repeat protein
LLPLTKQYVLEKGKSNPKRHVALRKKQAEYYLDVLLKLQQKRVQNPKVGIKARTKFREEEWENILDVINWWMAYEDEKYQDEKKTFVTHLLRQVCGHLWREGYWNHLEKYMQLGIEFSEKQNESFFEAYFTSRFGRLYLMRSELKRAEECYRHSLDIFRAKNEIRRIAHDASYLGLVYINQNCLEKAETLIIKTLKSTPRPSNPIAIARLLNVLARIYLTTDRIDQAEDALKDAITLRKNLGPSTGLAVSLQMLGRLRLKQGKRKEALEYFKKGLVIALQADLFFVAFTQRWLAIAHYQLRNTSRSKEALNQAIEVFNKLGMKKEAQKTEKLLDDIDKRRKIELPLN